MSLQDFVAPDIAARDNAFSLSGSSDRAEGSDRDRSSLLAGQRLANEALSGFMGATVVGGKEAARQIDVLSLRTRMIGSPFFRNETWSLLSQLEARAAEKNQWKFNAAGTGGALLTNALLDHTVFRDVPISLRTSAVDLLSPLVMLSGRGRVIAKAATLVGSHLAARGLDFYEHQQKQS